MNLNNNRIILNLIINLTNGSLCVPQQLEYGFKTQRNGERTLRKQGAIDKEREQPISRERGELGEGEGDDGWHFK